MHYLTASSFFECGVGGFHGEKEIQKYKLKKKEA